MTTRCSLKMVKAFEKFNTELNKFIIETESTTLYEDAFTPREVCNFKLTLSGKLTWTEDGRTDWEQMFDDDEANDYLKFWKACLRRAKRYWAMDTEELDRIQDPENELAESYE